MKNLNIPDNIKKPSIYVEEGLLKYGDFLVSNNKTSKRPVSISELKGYLDSRGWNIPKKVYPELSNQGFYLSDDSNLDLIPDLLDLKGMNLTDNTIPSNLVDEVHNKFKDLLVNMEHSELFLYNSPNKVIDLMEKSISSDIISSSKGDYSNYINLTPEINKLLSISCCSNGTKGFAKVDIKYTLSGEIFSENCTFELFRLANKKVEFRNAVIDYLEDVLVECINGNIKVLPKDKKSISEYIIWNCNLTINYE